MEALAIAAVVAYAFIAIGVFVEAYEGTDCVFCSSAIAILWPLVGLLRIGFWIGR